ncbi:MAG: hypothetical protein Q9207_004193 [Kuettlingeria erythrocarpa]
MEKGEQILLEFDQANLATWTEEGGWGCVRKFLADIETAVTAREGLPDDNPSKAGLGNSIQNLCGLIQVYQQLLTSQTDKFLCADHIRLLVLYDILKELPLARTKIKKILDNEVKKDDADGAKEAPGCRNPQAHKSLLKIWSKLCSESVNNTVVNEVVITAFLSHNGVMTPATESNKLQEEIRSLRSSQPDETAVRPWSIYIESLENGEKAFGGVALALVHSSTKAALELHVQESGPASGESNVVDPIGNTSSSKKRKLDAGESQAGSAKVPKREA